MSGAAARLDAPLRTGTGKAGAAPSIQVDENVAGLLRLVVFAAFATFSLAHWLGVIENPPVGRGLLVVLVCTLGGAALWATGLSPVPTRLAQIARPLIVLAMAVLSLLAAGLALHFLFPHGWHRLGPGLNRGLLGAQASIYPYTGGDPWVRLTLMLLGPLFLVPAAALAFWPAPRAGGVLRAASLVLLIGLFGMALAESTPNAQVGRGLALLVLIAAWLWLPRLRGNDAVAAAAALAVAAVVALPLAGALDKSGGWFDYRNWRLFSAKGGITYSWNQTYGPINWPRRGTTLLFVKSDRPYYWKAETLNSFDGTHWVGSTGNDGSSAASEIPIAPKRKWLKQIEVNISGLRGNLVVGAGTPYRISPDAGDTNTSADGTTTSVGHELHSGEHYTVSTYIPQPTVAEMRAAPAPPEGYYERYTTFELPGFAPRRAAARDGRPARGGRLRRPERCGHAPLVALLGHVPPGPEPRRQQGDHVRRGQLDRELPAQLEVRVQREAAGPALSTRVVRYQRPHRLLPAVLGRDGADAADGRHPRARGQRLRAGLTGFGGPWRVPRSGPGRPLVGGGLLQRASAGSPSIPRRRRRRPRRSSTTRACGAQVGGRTPRGLGQSQAPEAPGVATGFTPATTSHSGSGLWVAGVVLAGLGLLVLVGLWLRTLLLHRRAGGDAAEMALEELRTAVIRIGMAVAPGTTLAALERRLRTAAGPDAMRYVSRLREYRYGPEGATLPSRRDRRALRRALARSAGPLGRIRALRALPPAPHLPWRR